MHDCTGAECTKVKTGTAGEEATQIQTEGQPYAAHQRLSILSPLCTLRIAGLFLEAGYSKQADRSQTSQVKFLKQLLKFIENLRTFTSSDKNKWTECVSLYREFIPKVKVTLSDLKNTPTSRK